MSPTSSTSASLTVVLVHGAFADSSSWAGQGLAREAGMIEITQGALAAHVGATRESVNTWLGYFERQGYLNRERDGIAVLRLDELRARAEAE